MAFDIKKPKSNAFADKYRKTLEHRDLDQKAKGASVPKVLRRDSPHSKALMKKK